MALDPIVEEVRRAREELLAEHGGDIHKLMEFLKAEEAKHPERLISREELEQIKARPEGSKASKPGAA